MLSDRSTLVSAYTGAASLAVVAREVPDAVLLDIDPPDLDGIEVLRHIVCRPRAPPLVILTGSSIRQR